MKTDWRDVAVLVIFTAGFAAATTYLFKHPSDMNFATFAALFGTLSAAYHWIITYDSKHPDTP